MAHDDDCGDDKDRTGIAPQEHRIDQQTNRDKEDGAEHVAQWFEQHLDPHDLPCLCDHRADQKRTKRNAILKAHREQRDSEAKAKDRDEQHLVALEPCNIV